MNMNQVEICPACQSPDLIPYLDVKDLRVTQEAFHLLCCSQCGLVITTPRPDVGEIGRYYETDDYISHSATSRTFMDRLYYTVRMIMVRRKKALIEKFVQGRRLADVGAGSGFFAGYMQSKGWQVLAFEPNTGARAIAREQHQLDIREGEAFFAIPLHSLDAVTMWHVLEHVHDPNAYLSQICKCLTDDGTVFIAVPNYRSLDARIYREFWAAWDVPRHLWHFSPESMSRLLSRHGCEIIRQDKMPFDAFYVSLMSERYLGGGVLRMFRGMWVGLLSHLFALIGKGRASSILFVVRKAKSAHPEFNSQ